ncbi:MAG: helix-turn-helix domain-containing protein [Limisphaerales bacterium]
MPRAIAARKGSSAKARASVVAMGGNGSSSGNNNRALIKAISESKIYQEYERAFNVLTGLPVSLQPVETWQLPHHGKRNENPFCALVSQNSHACAACLQAWEQLCEKAAHEPKTITCQAGLLDTAVPVRLGDRLIGYLQTGQLLGNKPTSRQFERAARLVAGWGVDVDREVLRKAYYSTKVVTARQHESVVKLLVIFAQHLAMLGNQIFIQQKNAEPPIIKRAKEYIYEHHTEELSLARAAKAVNMSTFYFCKMFKKVTNINFTDYLSRVRIEKAKNLLLNPNLRVSEIAFEVGFQSLTHFNRVFKKLLGQSPTEYRAQLLAR